MSAVMRSPRSASVIAGILLILIAAWCYQQYSVLSGTESASLASVPRLKVSDLKLVYDRAVSSPAVRVAGLGSGPEKCEEPLCIIDVRSQAQYDKGHIRGAISIAEAALAPRIASVVPPSRTDALIVLYCA